MAGFWIHSYGPRWGFGPQRGPGSGGPNRRNGVPDQPPPLPARGPVCSRDHTLILLDSGSGGRRPRGARIQRKVLMDLGSRVGSRRPGPAYAASTWVPGGSQWAILGSYAAIDHCCSILRARAKVYSTLGLWSWVLMEHLMVSIPRSRGEALRATGCGSASGFEWTGPSGHSILCYCSWGTPGPGTALASQATRARRSGYGSSAARIHRSIRGSPDLWGRVATCRSSDRDPRSSSPSTSRSG